MESMQQGRVYSGCFNLKGLCQPRRLKVSDLQHFPTRQQLLTNNWADSLIGSSIPVAKVTHYSQSGWEQRFGMWKIMQSDWCHQAPDFRCLTTMAQPPMLPGPIFQTSRSQNWKLELAERLHSPLSGIPATTLSILSGCRHSESQTDFLLLLSQAYSWIGCEKINRYFAWVWIVLKPCIAMEGTWNQSSDTNMKGNVKGSCGGTVAKSGCLLYSSLLLHKSGLTQMMKLQLKLKQTTIHHKHLTRRFYPWCIIHMMRSLFSQYMEQHPMLPFTTQTPPLTHARTHAHITSQQQQ